MINVVCVKWGDKYTSRDVERLREMVSRHLTSRHCFYCYTDDPDNVDAHVIPIPQDNTLVAWWNKLAIFQRGFGDLSGRMLYLDLDVTIQKDIDEIVWYNPRGLSVVKAYWKGPQAINRTNFNMDVNSSVMTWNHDECAAIWEHFKATESTTLEKYIGMDRFLFHEGFSLQHWPEGWIYSRLNGSGLRANYYGYKKQIRREVFFCEEAKICVLNGVWSLAEEERRELDPIDGFGFFGGTHPSSGSRPSESRATSE